MAAGQLKLDPGCAENYRSGQDRHVPSSDGGAVTPSCQIAAQYRHRALPTCNYSVKRGTLGWAAAQAGHGATQKIHNGWAGVVKCAWLHKVTVGARRRLKRGWHHANKGRAGFAAGQHAKPPSRRR